VALRKQNFDIRFNKGVDTGHDSKTVIPSKFLRLENLEWDRTNSVRQRPGYTKQTITALSPSPTIVNVRRLHALGEEVLLEADTGLHAFLQNRTTARNGETGSVPGSGLQRTFERAQVDYRDIAESQEDMREVDAAVADPSRLECWVWTEPKRNSTDKSVFYRVIDSVTRAVVQDGPVHAVVNDIAQRPRVVVRNSAGISKFYIYYMVTSGGTTDLKMKSLTIASGAKVPGALSAATSMTAGNSHADAIFDAHYDSSFDAVVIGLKLVGTGALVLSTYLGSDGTTGVATNNAGVANLAAVSVTLTRNGVTAYALAVVQYGTNFVYAYSFIAGTGAAPLTTTLATPTSPTRVAVLPSPFTATDALVFFDFNPYAANAIFPNDIGYTRCAYDGSDPNTASTFAKGVVLAARPIAYYGTVGGSVDVCVPAAVLSELQPTVLMFKFGGSAFQFGFSNPADHTSPRVLARLFPGECGRLKSQYAASLRMPTCLAVS